MEKINKLLPLDKMYFRNNNLVGRYIKWVNSGEIDIITKNVNNIHCLYTNNFGSTDIGRFIRGEIEILPINYNPETESIRNNESKDFVLPEKWCVNVNNQKVKEYFVKQSNKSCYFNFHDGYYHRFNSSNEDIMIKGNLKASFYEKRIKKDYKEITFEQFEKHVLNNSDLEWVPKVDDWVVVLEEDQFYFNCEQGKAQKINEIYRDSKLPYQLLFSDGSTNTYSKIRKAEPHEIPKQEPEIKLNVMPIDMKEIQAECKRRFPIGCTYKSAMTGREYKLKNDNPYRIDYKDILACSGGGFLYYNGKYAELVSMPKSEAIVGKWYKLTEGRIKVIDGWYIKFSGIHENIITSSEHISPYTKKLSKSKSKFGYVGDYTLKLVEDLSEIQEYLPEDHEDKFTEKTEEVFEDLTGRYIKALVERPNGGRVAKGQYGKITINNEIVDFPQHSGYNIVMPLDKKLYQLMPKDFNPEGKLDKLLEVTPKKLELSDLKDNAEIFKIPKSWENWKKLREVMYQKAVIVKSKPKTNIIKPKIIPVKKLAVN